MKEESGGDVKAFSDNNGQVNIAEIK